MKAHFKYVLRTGLLLRGGMFAIIFVMDLVFITLGSLGLLPFAAHVTAVSLGGLAIAAMMAVNIVCDVSIAGCMFSTPEAYMFALVPSPRWRILLSSAIVMAAMDIITMAVVITGEVWLSINIAGESISKMVWGAFAGMGASEVLYGFSLLILMIACYLFFLMVIMFSVTAKKSILYKKPASGLLALLFGIACVYIGSLLWFVLAPFGSVSAYGAFITITVSSQAGLVIAVLLTLVETAGLFALTSRLMERKMNI